MKDEVKATNENVAKYLKELRLNEGLTMRVLAPRIKTPHSFVSKTEKQGRRMDVGELVLYCQAMNSAPDKALQEIIALSV